MQLIWSSANEEKICTKLKINYLLQKYTNEFDATLSKTTRRVTTTEKNVTVSFKMILHKNIFLNFFLNYAMS